MTQEIQILHTCWDHTREEIEILKNFYNFINTEFKIIKTLFNELKVGDIMFSFKYDLEHCGDTKEGKTPTVLILDRVIGYGTNGDIQLEIPSFGVDVSAVGLVNE